MLIKKVRICGFKNFCGSNVICIPFGRPVSVIVGAGNSGKTNFIRAIEFALDFTLNVDSLQPLVHDSESLGTSTSAFVEIVFDNAARMIQVDKAEVVLRRTFADGLIHADFDGRRIERIELKNLLQLMGITKSYPFYFCMTQNGVFSVVNADERALLHVLKQIAGIDDFLQATAKCHRIITDTNEELEMVTNLLAKMDVQLSSPAAVDNANEYQALLDKHRCLCALLDKCEMQRLAQTNDALLTEAESVDNQIDVDTEQLATIDSELKGKRALTKDLEALIDRLQREKPLIEAEHVVCVTNGTRLRAHIDVLENRLEYDATETQMKDKEKLFVDDLIEKKHAEAAVLEAELQRAMADGRNVEAALADRQKESDAIFERCSQDRGLPLIFYSVEERDAWIQQLLPVTETQITHTNMEIQKLVAELQVQHERSASLDSNSQAAEATTIASKQELERNESQHLIELQERISAMQREKKHVTVQESVVIESIARRSAVFQKANAALRSKIGSGIHNGIDSVRQIVTAHCAELAQHYHGLVIDQFTCDPGMHRLIDVVAKNKIFLHIVDSDVTATKILAAMNRLHLPGSPMFVPMNRVGGNGSELLSNKRSFINKLTYDARFANVMHYIFGRVLICRDLEHAVQEARLKTNVKCVTLSGDVVQPFGAISGGHLPANSQRIDAYNECKRAAAAVTEVEDKLTNIRRRQTELDDDIALNTLFHNEVGTKLAELRSEIQQGRSRLASSRRRMKSVQTRRDAKTAELKYHQTNLANLTVDRDRLKSELGQPMLPADAQVRVDQLKTAIDDLRTQHAALNQRCISLTKKCEQVAEFLSVHLIPRHDQLSQALQAAQQASDDLKNLHAEKQLADTALEGATDRLNAQCGRIDEAIGKLNEHKQAIKDALATRKQLKTKIEMDKRTLSAMRERADATAAKIKNMQVRLAANAPPADLATEYGHMNEAELAASLAGLQRRINAYKEDAGFAVTKQTLDRLNEERTALGHRRNDMLIERGKIRDTIEAENRRICGSILATFEMLQMYFGKTFRKFVPRGCATLTLNIDNNGAADNVDRFHGIEIRVSFTAAKNAEHPVDQLTDEQKSVVAVALVFAIQQCFRSPFYLVDCIDRVLGPKYILPFARILQTLSKTSQVIQTVSDPRLINSGNAFYHIGRNRADQSVIEQITVERAQSLSRQYQ